MTESRIPSHREDGPHVVFDWRELSSLADCPRKTLYRALERAVRTSEGNAMPLSRAAELVARQRLTDPDSAASNSERFESLLEGKRAEPTPSVHSRVSAERIVYNVPTLETAMHDLWSGFSSMPFGSALVTDVDGWLEGVSRKAPRYGDLADGIWWPTELVGIRVRPDIVLDDGHGAMLCGLSARKRRTVDEEGGLTHSVELWRLAVSAGCLYQAFGGHRGMLNGIRAGFGTLHEGGASAFSVDRRSATDAFSNSALPVLNRIQTVLQVEWENNGGEDWYSPKYLASKLEARPSQPQCAGCGFLGECPGVSVELEGVGD